MQVCKFMLCFCVLGIIIFYELWMRGILGSGTSATDRDPAEKRIFHPSGQYNPLPNAPPTSLPAPATNVTVDRLEPYTQYEFQVISQNILGKAASSWVTGRTLPSSKNILKTSLSVQLFSFIEFLLSHK